MIYRYIKKYIINHSHRNTSIQRKNLSSIVLLTYLEQRSGETYLTRWKLFGKSKAKKEESEKELDIPIIEDKETTKQEEKVSFETSEETEESPITEYHETLYSREHPSKKGKETWRRRSWESISTIEKNVDTIDKKKTVYKQTSSDSEGIDRKVNKLLSSRGIKTTEKKKEETSIVPEGYELKVNKKTGLTYYKKK